MWLSLALTDDKSAMVQVMALPEAVLTQIFVAICVSVTKPQWFNSLLLKFTLKQRRKTGAAPWWRHQMDTFSALLAICAGNSLVTGEFPAQRPLKRSFDVFFDLRLNGRLSKQSWGWWFETPLRPLWCHTNVVTYCVLHAYSFSVNFSILGYRVGWVKVKITWTYT